MTVLTNPTANTVNPTNQNSPTSSTNQFKLLIDDSSLPYNLLIESPYVFFIGDNNTVIPLGTQTANTASLTNQIAN